MIISPTANNLLLSVLEADPGVPQGSVMGLLLFLLLINNIVDNLSVQR